MPQDRDIVREMWVKGDLKDRLGIKHRRDIKNAGKSDLEQAPMFHKPHFRSESEISSFHPDADLHNSPLSRSPLSSNAATPPMSPSPAKQTEEDLLTPTARIAMNPSAMSYYSASNIPVATPTPPSPTSGGPPMSSIATAPVTTYVQQSHNTLQIPSLRSRTPNTPETFEMHVRQPSDDEPTPTSYRHGQEETEASYATAYDGYIPGPTPGHHQEDSWRGSTYSTGSGAHAL